jgi:hypothetical protein
MTTYDQKRIRTGKTLKDRMTNRPARNESNKILRAEWCGTSNDQVRSNRNFPKQTCNGKMNRYQIVTKKNGRIAKRV